MRSKRGTIVWVACMLGIVLCALSQSHAARKPVGERGANDADYAALKVLERGQELLELGERDRGVKMLETVIEQNPRSKIRFKAYLALGRHYLDLRENAKAIEHLRYMANLRAKEDDELEGRDLEMYLEGLYLMGEAHFHSREFPAAFSVLRRITENYPNTVWANQAYYYIGMAHFAQEHWSKAINNLNLVGTFIDPESPEVEFVEAGHRFFVKIGDGDLPVLKRLGRNVEAVVSASSGESSPTLKSVSPASRRSTTYW